MCTCVYQHTYLPILPQAHSKKVHELELLCSDMRAEIERLGTQDKAHEEKVVSLEQKLREMSERLKQAGSHSEESNDMDIQNLYAQGWVIFKIGLHVYSRLGYIQVRIIFKIGLYSWSGYIYIQS